MLKNILTYVIGFYSLLASMLLKLISIIVSAFMLCIGLILGGLSLVMFLVLIYIITLFSTEVIKLL